MRSFLTFLSLFSLLFFSAPVLCLQGEPSPVGEKEPLQIPQTMEKDGNEISTADLLVGRLAFWDLRGYHPQALRAATVVATSQLVARYRETGTADGFEVITPEAAKAQWGDYWFSLYWQEMQQAVTDVWGKTLTENGTLFSPKVFPLSWGQTAECIPCPYDFTANDFEQEISVSLEEFLSVFPQAETSLTVKKAQSNRVETVTSGDTVLSGTETAARFGLPSPCFTVTVVGEQVVFTCKGMGDGEGMSLYAANELAKRGNDYQKILAYFYPNGALS